MRRFSSVVAGTLALAWVTVALAQSGTGVPADDGTSATDPRGSVEQAASSSSVIKEEPVASSVPTSSIAPVSSISSVSSVSSAVSSVRSSSSVVSVVSSSVSSSSAPAAAPVVSSAKAQRTSSVERSSSVSTSSVSSVSSSSSSIARLSSSSSSVAGFLSREDFGYHTPVINPASVVRPEAFSLDPAVVAGNGLWTLIFVLVMGLSGWLLRYLLRLDPVRVGWILRRLPWQLAFTVVLVLLVRVLIPAANAQGTGTAGGASLLQIPIVAFLFFVIVGLSNTVFNGLLIEQRESINAFVLGRSDVLRRAWMIALLILIYGVVGGYIDPGFAILPTREIGVILITISSVILSAYVKDVMVFGLTRRLRIKTWFEGHIAGLAIAIACVALTRAFGLDPGYIYGIPAGLIIGTQLSRERQGLLEMAGMVSAIILALIVWVLGSMLHAYDVPLDLMNLLFVILVEDAFLELLPLPGLSGEAIWQWKKGLWAVLFAVVTFFLFHTLLNPQGTVASLESQPPALAAVLLLGCYVAGVLLLWVTVMWRKPAGVIRPR